jgi:hypothetical protein
MAGLEAYTFISTFFANSYLCIRVPITGSQKVTFPSPSLREVVFRGWNAHCGASGRGCWSCSQESYFLPTTCAQKKFLKKMQTPLLVQKIFWIPVVCVAGGVDMNPIITAHQEIVIENSVRYIELLKSEHKNSG